MVNINLFQHTFTFNKIKYSIKGLRNLRDDIRVMLGPKYTDNFTYYIWCALWGFISPALCVVI